MNAAVLGSSTSVRWSPVLSKALPRGKIWSGDEKGEIELMQYKLQKKEENFIPSPIVDKRRDAV